MRTNGKPELLTRVIKLYLAESPKLDPEAQAGGGAPATRREIARSAHSLKSCSANVGARGAEPLLRGIEARRARADTEEARKIFAKIETEHGSVQTRAQRANSRLLAAGQS